MSYKGHDSMAEELACTESQGKAWVARTHTEDEWRAAAKFMFRSFTQDTIDTWPTGMIEALIEWKLIADELDAAHRHIWAGGGIEAPDHVRSLLLIEQRMGRIADAHHKNVDEHGGTWGDCNECGWSWPCPTYVWATSDDRDPLLACWNPSDDEDDSTVTGPTREPT